MAAHLLSAGDRGGESPLYNVDHLLELWDEIHAPRAERATLAARRGERARPRALRRPRRHRPVRTPPARPCSRPRRELRPRALSAHRRPGHPGGEGRRVHGARRADRLVRLRGDRCAARNGSGRARGAAARLRRRGRPARGRRGRPRSARRGRAAARGASSTGTCSRGGTRPRSSTGTSLRAPPPRARCGGERRPTPLEPRIGSSRAHARPGSRPRNQTAGTKAAIQRSPTGTRASSVRGSSQRLKTTKTSTAAAATAAPAAQRLSPPRAYARPGRPAHEERDQHDRRRRLRDEGGERDAPDPDRPARGRSRGRGSRRRRRAGSTTSRR